MSKQAILVTGANKGIGLQTVADILRTKPESTVFLGSRNAQRGAEATATIQRDVPGSAGRVHLVQLDVADDGSVAAAADQIAQTLGPGGVLQGIVNNAGVGFDHHTMPQVLNINTRGPKRVVHAMTNLLASNARVVNISSASGPSWLANCGAAVKQLLTSEDVTWEQLDALMAKCVQMDSDGGDFAAEGLGENNAYGLSKACLNAYTIHLARTQPGWTVNACTPGFIETDMTRPFASNRGVTPESMGMKSVDQGTKAAMHLLFGEPGGSGWYFGSDAVRSPLDRYRSPGDPPYTGQ